MRQSKILFDQLADKLTSIYEPNEAKSIVFLLFELTNKIITQNYNFEPLIQRLLNHEPVQYIIGNTYFYGSKFVVLKGTTLIPRPETEELVELAISKLKELYNNQAINVLDIGTGTGCIAISIAKSVKNALVSAWDVSKESLSIAKLNAELNDVKVTFNAVNVLDFSNGNSEKYDMVISNPPYVTISEKANMNKNVLDYEPELALFVDDNDPLMFYKKIGEIAIEMLCDNGYLLFEINERFGHKTAKCLALIGFEKIEIIKDINGKDRIISCQKASELKKFY
jgi:release factor glutamine methyltransferase